VGTGFHSVVLGCKDPSGTPEKEDQKWKLLEATPFRLIALL
jgi:hypothetical protein